MIRPAAVWKIAPWLVIPAMACLWLGLHLADVRYYFPAAILVTLAFSKVLTKNRLEPISLSLGLSAAFFCFFLAPDLSDDFHRYLFEGHAQNHGYSPYLHSPQSLYQQLDHPSEGLINHDHLPAIYPPLAQYLFRLSDLISNRVWGWKLVLVCWCGVWSVMLRRPAFLWLATVPIVTIEGWWNAHLDLAGLVPCLVLVESLEKQRPWRSGLALGSLIALKTMPLIWLPFAFIHLSPRHRVKFCAAILGVVLLCYAPYLSQGEALFHSFMTFSKTWSFNNLPYIALSALFGSTSARIALAVAFLVGFCIVFFKVKGFRRQCLSAWILLIVCSPTFYPWYLLWLVPMTPISGLRIFNLAYLGSFLSYWVLVDYRATQVWRERWSWLVLEWLIMGFCFFKLTRLPADDASHRDGQGQAELSLDAP